jgi:hypothetical protein
VRCGDVGKRQLVVRHRRGRLRKDGGNGFVVPGSVMTVHGESSTGSVHAVIAYMASEYDGVVPPGLVATVVRDAERDLRGQVVPGSLSEMLHRLAAFRLQELSGIGVRRTTTGTPP